MTKEEVKQDMKNRAEDAQIVDEQQKQKSGIRGWIREKVDYYKKHPLEAVGKIVGGGILADRFHLKPVLMFLGIMGAIVMSLMGFQSNQFLLYILVFLAGAASIGSQMLLYSYVAQFYPLAVRSTGIGWSSAIGRMGAIVGPILIGGLLGMNLPAHFNFIAVGLPVLITAIAVALIMHDDEPEKIAVQNVAAAKA